MSKQGPAGTPGLQAPVHCGGHDNALTRLAASRVGGHLLGKELGRASNPLGIEEMLVRAHTQQPVQVGGVDIEAFSRNVARLVEEGGRALAAYLKPREAGRSDREFADEAAEVVKTLGQVAEYWLADPRRAVELQTRLGKAYLDLWGTAVKRLGGEPAPPLPPAAPRD